MSAVSAVQAAWHDKQNCTGSIAARPCKQRKDGAPTVPEREAKTQKAGPPAHHQGSSGQPMKRILILFCALVVLTATGGCFKRPAVRLENSGSSVIVHIETLGEYPTTVRHIRLKDASSGKVIFELLTESGTPQIYSFRLSVGENSTHVADPEHGSYRVAEPSGKDTFSLQPGVRYRLTIWGNGRPSSETDLKF